MVPPAKGVARHDTQTNCCGIPFYLLFVLRSVADRNPLLSIAGRSFFGGGVVCLWSLADSNASRTPVLRSLADRVYYSLLIPFVGRSILTIRVLAIFGRSFLTIPITVVGRSEANDPFFMVVGRSFSLTVPLRSSEGRLSRSAHPILIMVGRSKGNNIFVSLSLVNRFFTLPIM